jgi:hypothetical protein
MRFAQVCGVDRCQGFGMSATQFTGIDQRGHALENAALLPSGWAIIRLGKPSTRG